MSRKVTIELTIKVQATLEEAVKVSDFVNELDYNIRSTTDDATIEDTEILDFEVKDSK